VRLIIGHGHDGPARRGKIHIGNRILTVPTFLGPADSIHTGMKYHSDSASHITENKSELDIFSTGTILDYASRASDDIPAADSLYLLPSMLGLTALPSGAGSEAIKAQLNVLSRISLPADNAVLRIPWPLPKDELKTLIPLILDSDIQSVAFTFDGRYGPRDLGNLTLRGTLPRHWLVLALGRIRIEMVPVLYYSGFDILDIGHAFESAANLVRMWNMMDEHLTSGGHLRYCSCKHCDRLQTSMKTREMVSILLAHNTSLYAQTLSSCVTALETNSLRWLLESVTHYSPDVASFIRKTDAALASFYDEFTPSNGGHKQPLIGPESYNAPIVRRFREQVRSRYRAPQEKKAILLLPCSARKPYSDSKSHRRFNDSIQRTLGDRRSALAEVIITSPLGIVPRELERIYPAGHYDIPVTGEWDYEETSLAADALVAHLGKFDASSVVVAHVSGGYLDVVQRAEDRIKQSIIYTSHDKPPTSHESLLSLRETLSDISEMYTFSPQRSQLENTVRATADYMFGQGAGEALVPDGAKVGGKVYGSIISRVDKQQTCFYSGESGSISLTLEGGKRLSSIGQYWVKFEGDHIEGSSIFAVAVDSADRSIRPGDEVVVLDRDGEVIGVGRSEMSGQEMCDFSNGVAVRVRHKSG
jgi:archaeosine synthase